ncbi:Protein roadkill [Frankliniella fusca]|uniref:Protein roadkill n=1 Tax=Frankliniella fusca TaxID=407009 RepID=A0AAE1HP79_9NEOP|nr:Protein roadkill [Frankliniella fusca]
MITKRFCIPTPAKEGIYEELVPDIIVNVGHHEWRWSLKFQVTVDIGSRFNLKGYCVMYDVKHPSSRATARWGAHFKSIDSNNWTSKADLPCKERLFQQCYRWIILEYHKLHANEFDWIFELEVEDGKIELAPDAKLFKGASHATLSQSFDSLLQSGLLSDVKLCSEGKAIPAHRAILAARSEFFKAKFKPEWNEETVAIDVSPPVLKEMLRYMYSGSFGESVDIISLLIAADMYLITDLCNELKERIEEGLKLGKPIAPIFEMLKLSVLHNSKHLRSIVLRYISDNREKVLKSKEWTKFQQAHRKEAAEVALDLVNMIG